MVGRVSISQSPAEREADVAATFIQLAELATTCGDEVQMLELVAHACVRILDADAAGVSLGSDGALGFVVATSETMDLIELFQSHHQEGPCMAAFRSGVPTRVSDLDVDAHRWPRWGARARELGFRAAEAFPMRHGRHVIGVIDLYATRPRTLNERDLVLGNLLAQMATIAVIDHRANADLRTVNDQLNRALESRVIIEQAKGILAERHQIDPAASFELLRTHSRSSNAKLREVAHRVVHDDLDLASVHPPS